MSLSVVAMSDLHGDLPRVETFKECEVAFICGDISPLNIQANDRKMKKWLVGTFKPWCEALPCDKVFFIAGNHDWVALRDSEFMRAVFPMDGKVTYLYHEKVSYVSKEGKEYKLFGTPFCKQFGNWAFMEEDDELAKLYTAIPYDLDILLSHDQPYGYGDFILQEIYWDEGQHIGNKPLLEAVFVKQPKYMFCGHLHATTHECVEIIQTKRYNVSLKDEYYDMVYKPLYLDI